MDATDIFGVKSMKIHNKRPRNSEVEGFSNQQPMKMRAQLSQRHHGKEKMKAAASQISSSVDQVI
jgi:hypothetical protein